ncbi:MAG: ThuA domain-containing protein [Opitutaceae bacterium]|nr:ThuA domain-containing protein [Opitutaceae bacterium]
MERHTHHTRVLVWNEYRHERTNPFVSALYPNGIHAAIADCLRDPDREVATATLDEPEHGLSVERLDNTDVLLWWGHIAHEAVEDEVVERVKRRVHEGMGLIVLHSGHFSKIFKSLLGTPCSLKWREATDRERIWCVRPSHPIASGIPEQFVLEREEMYGEPFAIPEPDELVFISWFSGGEVFRSGATWQRGHGRVFYFRPGHETFPTYHHSLVQRVLTNAVDWAAPTVRLPDACPKAAPLEPLPEA